MDCSYSIRRTRISEAKQVYDGGEWIDLEGGNYTEAVGRGSKGKIPHNRDYRGLLGFSAPLDICVSNECNGMGLKELARSIGMNPDKKPNKVINLDGDLAVKTVPENRVMENIEPILTKMQREGRIEDYDCGDGNFGKACTVWMSHDD